MTLINLYNQKGAGPKNIALNFINEAVAKKTNDKFIVLIPKIKDYQQLDSTIDIQFLRLTCYKSVAMKVLFRIYLEIFLIPVLVRKHHIKTLLAFGNFLFAPIKCKKLVLLHHPYLVDDKLYKKLDFKSKYSEALKRIAFFVTTKNIDTIVVQSGYMQHQLEGKYSYRKFSIEVIPNPISKSFGNQIKGFNILKLFRHRTTSMTQTLDLLYVSRFYPHKNHRFLVNLSKSLNHQNIKHRVIVTVDPSMPEAKGFLADIAQSETSIVNLTELEQARLIEHYQNAHLFIFPSSAETFGNPLIEAMCYGLPILVPDLEYAHSIVGVAGTYYHENSDEDCVEQIKSLINDPELYLFKSNQSLQQFKNYPNTTEWFEQYMTLIR